MNCPKCEGEMERGFIPDWGHGGQTKAPFWYSGVFKSSFWGGIKDVKHRRQFYVLVGMAAGLRR